MRIYRISTKFAIKNLFSSGQGNLLKVVCLAAGLSLGLVMIAKVCFIQQYNNCIADRERVYILQSCFQRDKEEGFVTVWNTSGGVAPGVAAEIPEIEAATRMTGYNNRDGRIVLPDGSLVKAYMWLADSCVFDVLGIRVLAGNPKEILSQRGHGMVSLDLAQKLGGVEQALGMTVAAEDNKAMRVTIDGVFETVPENCSVAFDMLVSINAMPEYSLNNWIGNDRYMSFIKFAQPIDRDEMTGKMQEVMGKHVDVAALQDKGVEIRYALTSMDELARDDRSLQKIKWVMLFMGAAILIISILNYLVLVISTLVNRTKQIAVEKCYGALLEDIVGMTLAESAVHLGLALALAACMILMMGQRVEELLDASLASVFSPTALLIILCICAGLMLVTTIVPAIIFDRVPVGAAFRTMREAKRMWKLTLLSLQIVLTGIIVGLLAVISLQYRNLSCIDAGYDYSRLMVVETTSMDESRRHWLMDELRKLPQVEDVSSCCQLPYGASGNNIFDDGGREQLFNVADMYFVSEHYFDVMGIKVVEGQPFSHSQRQGRTMMVNQEFVRKMRTLGKLEGSIIGTTVIVSEHSEDVNDRFTVTGVCEDFRLGTPKDLQLRPMTFFFEEDRCYFPPSQVLVKLHELTPANVQKVNDFLDAAAPGENLWRQTVRSLIERQLNDERNTRDALTICSIVALVISLVGLIGYTTDEVNRRRREMAIRRILGATAGEVLTSLARDITFIAIPSLILGSLAAVYLSSLWLQNYSDRIDLSLWLFAATSAAIYLLILSCVLLRSLKAAREKPAVALGK